MDEITKHVFQSQIFHFTNMTLMKMRHPNIFITIFFMAALVHIPTDSAAQNNQWVTEKEKFVNIIEGKTLNRFLIELSVKKDGTIVGTGAGAEVIGNWSWQDNYFCRKLIWGDRDLGSDCQKVELKDRRLFFTSDRGRGATAGFTLR